MKELEMGAAEMWYLFISCSEGFKNITDGERA